MSRDSFVFYRSFVDALTPLNDEDCACAFRAVSQYALDGIEPNLDALQPVVRAVFILVKPQMDANHRRYANGKKGGRPKGKEKPKHNQSITKPEPNVHVHAHVNVKESITYVPEFEEFWIAYPSVRKGNKKKAYAAYQRALKENRGTAEEINAGCLAYVKSEPGGYAKGCEAWLNDDRWTYDYAPEKTADTSYGGVSKEQYLKNVMNSI